MLNEREGGQFSCESLLDSEKIHNHSNEIIPCSNFEFI